MRLEKLRVIDDSNVPSRSRIKDALVEIPDDVLLKIISDYNEANNLAPIYKATEENIKKLKEEGKEVPSNAEDNFAFLTPNSYGGTEGFNYLQEKIDYDTELVPFVEANFTTYKNDLPVVSEEDIQIQDIDDIFDDDWLRDNWKQHLVGHKERANNIEQIYHKVYKAGETELANKVLNILKRYNQSPIAFSYNKAKKELFNIFENNAEKKQDIDQENKFNLKKKVIQTYNKKYKKNLNPESDYEKLPESWKNKFTPLIETGRKETIEKGLAYILEGEKIEKDLVSLKKKFQNIFNFNYDDTNAIKGFAYDNDLNGEVFAEVIANTFKAYEEDETKKNPRVSWDEAVDFFKTIRHNPSAFIRKSTKWNGLKTENVEAKQEEAEAEQELEISLNSDEDVKKFMKKLEANKPWYQYFLEHYEGIKELRKDKKMSEEQAKTALAKLIKYCMLKANLTTNTSTKNKITQSQKEKNLISQIKSKIGGKGRIEEGFNLFYKDIEKQESDTREKYLNKILKLLEKETDNQVLSQLTELNDEQIKKFFIEFVKGKDEAKANEIISKIKGN